MKTRHHLTVALINAGMEEQDAEALAREAYATEDPRKFVQVMLQQAEGELTRLTIVANALRHVTGEVFV